MPSSGDFGRAFAIGIALNLSYLLVEAAFGAISGSLALLADAGHNLGDVLALSLAWGATILARRRPSPRFTYGLRSSSILAALVNAVILLVVTGGIVWEALRRLESPVAVAGGTVIWVACAGILVNGATALLFLSGSRHDLNVRSAFLHLVADALVTVGVVIAAAAISLTGWMWLDPLASLLVSVVVVIGTWHLLRSAVGLALDAVPEGIDPGAVRRFLNSVPGVCALHDLHIWGMSTTETALTCHLVMPAGHPGDAALSRISERLQHEFGIHHTTLQIELSDTAAPCVLTPEHVV